jgi:hypothetical protein
MQRPDDELVGVDTAAHFLGCSPTKVSKVKKGLSDGQTKKEHRS